MKGRKDASKQKMHVVSEERSGSPATMDYVKATRASCYTRLNCCRNTSRVSFIRQAVLSSTGHKMVENYILFRDISSPQKVSNLVAESPSSL